ncbi:MAG TPA: DUF6164 family protein [Cellvibrionaceae bacterium]
MAKLLIKIRGATAEEVEGMVALLEEQQIACYLTDAGRWRIGVEALWLTHDDQYDRARELIDEFQQNFSRERREHWQQLRESGQAPTFLQQLFMHPIKVLLALVGITIIAAISLLPFFLM